MPRPPRGLPRHVTGDVAASSGAMPSRKVPARAREGREGAAAGPGRPGLPSGPSRGSRRRGPGRRRAEERQPAPRGRAVPAAGGGGGVAARVPSRRAAAGAAEPRLAASGLRGAGPAPRAPPAAGGGELAPARSGARLAYWQPAALERGREKGSFTAFVAFSMAQR